MNHTNKLLIAKLDLLKQTRSRESIGRPCYFKDKTKYSRNVSKSELKRNTSF